MFRMKRRIKLGHLELLRYEKLFHFGKYVKFKYLLGECNILNLVRDHFWFDSFYTSYSTLLLLNFKDTRVKLKNVEMFV